MALHSSNNEGHGKNPHVHLVVKAEHEYSGRRLNPRKADLQRWRERFAEYLNELGIAATATRRDDRGLAKTQKRTPIYRAAQREPNAREPSRQSAPLQTAEGDSIFMRKKLEAIRRQVRAGGDIERGSYNSLLNIRGGVDARYAEAVVWLRSQGREEEARRFEMTHRHLAPVRTENQLIAESMQAHRGRAPQHRGADPPRLL